MKMNIALPRKLLRSFFLVSIMISVLLPFPVRGESRKESRQPDPDEIERRINAYVPDKLYPDDPFVLVAVREALAGFRENNGGVGACLVEEATTNADLKLEVSVHQRFFSVCQRFLSLQSQYSFAAPISLCQELLCPD